MPRSLVFVLACSILATGCQSLHPPGHASPGKTKGAAGALATNDAAPRSHRSVPSTTRSPAVNATSPNGSAAQDRAQVARGMNAFGAAIYHKLRRRPGNLIWSPASVSIALTMAYAGARGKTAAEMRRALHLTLDDARLHRAAGDLLAHWNASGGPYKLRVENRVYADRSMKLLPAYLKLSFDRYRAPVELLDMKKAPAASARQINGWVSHATDGHIPKIIDAHMLTHDPLLVLVDAVYFKGKWETPFDRSDTQDMPFTLAGGRRVKTPMMYVENDFGFAKLADGTKVLRLPYEGGSLELIVALPAKPNGIRALERSINGDTVAGWIKRASYQNVRVYLPRFRLAPGAIDLSADLRALGMPLAFSDAADFSGISATRAAKISHVLHRGFVKVDEEGTVAAAATATTMVAAGAEPPRPAKKFNADHPFLFFIRDDQSGALLFWGRLAHPAPR